MRGWWLRSCISKEWSTQVRVVTTTWDCITSIASLSLYIYIYIYIFVYMVIYVSIVWNLMLRIWDINYAETHAAESELEVIVWNDKGSLEETERLMEEAVAVVGPHGMSGERKRSLLEEVLRTLHWTIILVICKVITNSYERGDCSIIFLYRGTAVQSAHMCP